MSAMERSEERVADRWERMRQQELEMERERVQEMGATSDYAIVPSIFSKCIFDHHPSSTLTRVKVALIGSGMNIVEVWFHQPWQ